MLGDARSPAVPMDEVIAKELEILGVHGMQAHRYPELLAMIRAGRLQPERLVARTIALDEVVTALPEMAEFPGWGITVVDRF